MNLDQMKSLSKDELLEKLNQDFNLEPEKIINQLKNKVETEDLEGLCAECYSQTVQKQSGDEGWTWCEACHQTEGQVYEVTVVPSLNIAYNWDLKLWIPYSEDMGSSL